MDSAPHRAAGNGSTRVAELLIDKGIKVDRDDGGLRPETALHRAVITGHAEMSGLTPSALAKMEGTATSSGPWSLTALVSCGAKRRVRPAGIEGTVAL